MLESVVDARALTRTFGSRTAVRDLSLTVRGGEIVALLGPNGAGKTTTLRMIAGLLRPSSGGVHVHGSVGLLTESPGLWDALSVRLNLLTHARLHGLKHPHARVDDGLRAMGLADRATDRAGELSTGLRQRVAIARALLHDPSAVLLDEPTSGLDPASARHVRDIIVDLRQQGRGVLISTHNLTEAESLADRIAILKVDLLALDTPARLRAGASVGHVDIGVEGDASRWTANLEDTLRVSATANGSHLRVALEDGAAIPDVVSALVAAGARVTRVTPDGGRTLEDVYLDLVGRFEDEPGTEPGS